MGVQVSCGANHGMALTEAPSEVYAWGRACYGQLGIGHFRDLPADPVDRHDHYQAVPRVIEGLKGCAVIRVMCGNGHSMALTSEGQVYTWGLARNGTLGVGDFLSLPTDPAYTHDHYQDVPEVMMNLPHGIEERFSIAIGASHSICAYADIGGDQIQEALETFARYVDCDELADVRFLIGEGSDATQVMAHSQLLSMRCEYFRNTFSSDMRERTRDGPHKYEVAVPDTTVACFKCVLYWAYTGSTAFNSENICGACLRFILENFQA